MLCESTVESIPFALLQLKNRPDERFVLLQAIDGIGEGWIDFGTADCDPPL